MINIKFILNDEKIAMDVPANMRFLDVLRKTLGLSGMKEGCGEGECGACAVLIDGDIVNSCIYPAANLHGKKVTTIEGFSKTKRFEVLEDAFVQEGAVQCGICIPGMILAAESLLNKNPHPSVEEIKIGLSGNLCRCTGYNMIIKAILRASKKGDGLW